MALCRTLGLLKPDITANPVFLDQVLAQIRNHPTLSIAHQKAVHWSAQDAQSFYAEHRGKFFYQRLCDYMTSGPFTALILEGPDAIRNWRSLIGPTHPIRARLSQPQTLRAQFGLTDTRNSFHGSDSYDTALREIKFFFPELPL
ncbi:hypothetical protein H4R35_000631 [Dimargaris xerosporica]|nr:hypothetical protein H4R35_000631 [Dimargaris xerosporica]